MIRYKINVLSALKERGYSTYRLSKEKLLPGEATIQSIREGKLVSMKVLSKLCAMLDCDVGDILEYVPEGDNDA